jgi:protein O-GlcNAc transferase
VGHMGGHRLLVFARKPAPIQVTAWGEPTGTGLTAMDYLLADPVLVPESERTLLAEQVFDLPNFLGYWVPDSLPEPGALPAIANCHVTFGSFNRLAKIQDPVLRSWAAILRALPDARLVIKGDLRDGEPGVEEAIVDVFAKEGIGRERFTLLGYSARADHFKAYQQIDIALDPFPHGGGMTTLDALWMGVPVVTWSGHTISSRLSAASLTALGLTDFIAGDRESYISLAVEKSSNLDALARLRSSLRERVAGSAIGDPLLYARTVEAAYRQMWRRWCSRIRS